MNPAPTKFSPKPVKYIRAASSIYDDKKKGWKNKEQGISMLNYIAFLILFIWCFLYLIYGFVKVNNDHTQIVGRALFQCKFNQQLSTFARIFNIIFYVITCL